MQSRIIYPNVRIEMARLNWNLSRLSKESEIPVSTLHDKLTGKSVINLDEAGAIKSALHTEKSYEDLFDAMMEGV